MLRPYSYGCGEWCMRGLFELQTSGSYQMRLRRLTPVHLASSGAGWAAPWEQLPEMKTTNLQTSKLLHIEDLKGWNKWNTKIPVNTFNQKGHAAADPCMDKFSVPVWMKPAAFGMLILWKCRRTFCTCRVFDICCAFGAGLCFTHPGKNGSLVFHAWILAKSNCFLAPHALQPSFGKFRCQGHTVKPGAILEEWY